MQEFKDKVAVITGAASGIGHGIAERVRPRRHETCIGGH